MAAGELPDTASLDVLARASDIVVLALCDARSRIAPGVKPSQLSQAMESVLVENGAAAALRTVRAHSGDRFPAAACVSVNGIAVNGVPTDTPLKQDDVLTLDVACEAGGWHADAATTVTVGVSPHPVQLAASSVLDAVLAAIAPGVEVASIATVYTTACSHAGVYAVHEVVLHGIGRSMHEPPSLLGTEADPPGAVIREGQVLAVEPVISSAPCRLVTGSDNWSRIAVPLRESPPPEGRLLTAYEERTVVVERTGVRNLTRVSRFDD